MRQHFLVGKALGAPRLRHRSSIARGRPIAAGVSDAGLPIDAMATAETPEQVVEILRYAIAND
jgi:hypothetical protein